MVRGQDQDLVKTWSLARVRKARQLVVSASEVQAGTRFRFEGGRQLSVVCSSVAGLGIGLSLHACKVR